MQNRSGLAHCVQLSHQRMGGVDFVVPVGANQEQMLHIRPRQEVFEQIERGWIEPLQVVEKQGERTFRTCEDADKPPKYQLKTALGVLRRKLRRRWLFTYDVLQFRDEFNNKQTIWTQCFVNGIAPFA